MGSRKRSKRLYVYWAIALTLLLGLGVFCWTVVVPVVRGQPDVGVASWGSVSNGLRCRLSAPTGSFEVPGPVRLKLEIENISDGDIYLPYEPVVIRTYATSVLYTAPHGSFRAEKVDGAGGGSTIFADCIKEYAKSVGFKKVTIPKNGIWSKDILLLVGVHDFQHATYPGLYRLRFELRGTGAPEYWKGRLRSNELLIEVRRPEVVK